ncbi:hypothetical protein [Archangium primigenium]|uniref:hypothetical protein n=1 Tax=[Archangium] primigenium TaxID=2792470 RepID=UPI001959D9C2|nr:hypothetical protein [Archangium primigenium]MBM7112385.1 hypothetical protein [Archangium primigenium]
MADATNPRLESLLRRRLSAFIHRESVWRPAVRSIQERTQARDWTMFLFGGTLRDLLALAPSTVPRDLDLVVAGTTRQELESVFQQELVRVNRFGGLHLVTHKLPVDMWTLESTWAFRERLVPGGEFSDLPRTTFLNVEAIAAEFHTRPGRARTLYTRDFFRGIQERQVEINLEDNPFPALCIVRSLITAQRLRFSLGPRLVRYFLHHARRIPLEEMEAIQRSHYGRVRINRHTLHMLNRLVREQASHTRLQPISLPRAKQLPLRGVA